MSGSVDSRYVLYPQPCAFHARDLDVFIHVVGVEERRQFDDPLSGVSPDDPEVHLKPRDTTQMLYNPIAKMEVIGHAASSCEELPGCTCDGFQPLLFLSTSLRQLLSACLSKRHDLVGFRLVETHPEATVVWREVLR